MKYIVRIYISGFVIFLLIISLVLNIKLITRPCDNCRHFNHLFENQIANYPWNANHTTSYDKAGR